VDFDNLPTMMFIIQLIQQSGWPKEDDKDTQNLQEGLCNPVENDTLMDDEEARNLQEGFHNSVEDDTVMEEEGVTTRLAQEEKAKDPSGPDETGIDEDTINTAITDFVSGRIK